MLVVVSEGGAWVVGGASQSAAILKNIRQKFQNEKVQSQKQFSIL